MFKLFQEKAAEAPLKLFGLFGIVNYPLFYFFWKLIPDSRYDDLKLRAVATILCLGLFLKDFWPKKLQKFLSLYWYLTITFCIPFMGTYIFLQNEASSSWILNVTLGVFLMLFVLDWLSFAVVLIIGITIATLSFLILDNQIHIIAENFLSTISNILWVIVVAIIFSRRHELLQKEKRSTLILSSSAIAHEMRTPLSTVAMISHAFQSKFINLRKQTNTLSFELSLKEKDVVVFEDLANDLRKTAQSAQTFIDLMLINLKQDIEQFPLSNLSAADVINQALSTYPFNSDEEHLITLTVDQDFNFLGNSELIKHVLFNLMKNSFYFIHASNKGKINIIVTSHKNQNIIIFRDTACGIPSKKLPKLFEPFNSNRPHGTGIGLAFCKRVIENFNGKIIVESILNTHTTFTISFNKN